MPFYPPYIAIAVRCVGGATRDENNINDLFFIRRLGVLSISFDSPAGLTVMGEEGEDMVPFPTPNEAFQDVSPDDARDR